MSIKIKDVRDLITYACSCCDVPDLNGKITVTINPRTTVTAGKAIIKYNSMFMELSLKVCQHGGEDFVWQTVVHEACHLIDYYKNGKMSDHGPSWIKLMTACGVEPEMYHSVIINRIEYQCECGKIYHLSKQVVNKIKSKTKRYSCKCSKLIQIK